MPQMAPINWLILYFIFILTFIMFSILNFYIYLPIIKTFNKKSINKFNLIWKW